MVFEFDCPVGVGLVSCAVVGFDADGVYTVLVYGCVDVFGPSWPVWAGLWVPEVTDAIGPGFFRYGLAVDENLGVLGAFSVIGDIGFYSDCPFEFVLVGIKQPGFMGCDCWWCGVF